MARGAIPGPCASTPQSFRNLPMLSLLLAWPLIFDQLHDRAEELIEAGDPASAALLLEERLQRTSGEARTEELYGLALIALERSDEGAHWLERSVTSYTATDAKRSASRAEKALYKADPLARKRASLLAGLVRDLYRAAERLEDSDQPERALEMYQRLHPVAVEKAKREIAEAIERIESVDREVDLDAAGAERDSTGAWPRITLETEHYDLVCNLEPQVVDQLAITVEDIFAGFVNIYFDGETRRAPSRRVTIKIHATWDAMADHYPGGIPSPGVQGWWSPGSAETHAYDARTRGGSLDSTLLTLLHEGSHQFMSTFARGGTPAWINEGTACFFEGATTMADGRVLWPDAAQGRLMALAADLTTKPRRGPRVREVISHPGPGSYPGDYYHHGWGLAYFLQQWEHPETLEYAFRPHYLELIDRYSKRSGNSLAVFEEIVLGDDSPLGHSDMDTFIADWERWIIEEVLPLHQGPLPERRRRRLERAERYLMAADGSSKLVEVPEEDLLLRALGDLEVVRSELDASTPHRDVLELLANVLERLDRGKTAAAMIEEVLNGADGGAIELTPEEYEAFEKRLKALDRSNFALRTASARKRSHTSRMVSLVETYQDKHPDMVLRAYTLAAEAADALGDEGVLLEVAGDLREQAKTAGRLLGRVVAGAGRKSAWKTAFTNAPNACDVGPDGVRVASTRPFGMIDTSVRVHGEYELRGRLVRTKERHLGTAHGLVVAGTTSTDWTVIGIDEDGHVGVWSVRLSGGGGARFKYLETIYLDEEIAEGAEFDLAVRVYESGVIEITVDDQTPVETEFLEPPEGVIHVGVFARDGDVRVEGLTVEIFP